MRKRSCGWDKRGVRALLILAAAGCATPQYSVRGTPVPDESASAVQIERQISAMQAQEFERLGARPIGGAEWLGGLPIQQTISRVSRVTERPSLPYRGYLYQDDDPNAASLADGRIYMSSGMTKYLAGRGSRVDELAFILAHELGHTVAQHLVTRYRLMQQQALLMTIVAAGASVATRNASASAQQAGQLAVNAASLLRDVANSGYSQQDELEADQLGIRYVQRAGYDPHAALDLLQDFARFDQAGPFLRTHPYITTRRAYLKRYVEESKTETEERVRQLRQAQLLYPKNSVSWQNLQRQIDALRRPR